VLNTPSGKGPRLRTGSVLAIEPMITLARNAHGRSCPTVDRVTQDLGGRPRRAHRALMEDGAWVLTPRTTDSRLATWPAPAPRV